MAMDGLLTLLGLSGVMGIASFAAGLLPLTLSLSSSHLHLISTFGMGLLVGTALVVIIPEGVSALYSAAPSDHSHPEMSGVSVQGTRSEKVASFSAHAWVGPPLIAGIVVMLLVDKIPRLARSRSPPRPYHVSLSDLDQGSRGSRGSSELLQSDRLIGEVSRSDVKGGRGLSVTTGLVIHASADGIALGASSSASNTELSFIIFLAIMMHKGPAAFGLTSQLLQKDLSKRSIRAHLLVFSLAAPAGAIVTWLLAQSIGASMLENAVNTQWWTAMLLLFSGGTFLYVAMDAMRGFGVGQEHGTNSDMDDHGDVGEPPQPAQGGKRNLLLAVIGMLSPLFLQIGHAH